MKNIWNKLTASTICGSNSCESSAEDGNGPKDGRKGGLSFAMASFFLVAQMAGAGFLALPKAMGNAGWSGAALCVIFCVSVGFSGTRLGRCWVILEERWEEYRTPTRQPYMDIANRALGIHGRRFSLFCMLVTLIGSTIVFIILIAGMMNSLIPVLSQCQWVLITAGVILPFTWLGTPKDFWQASVLAVITTALAVIVIVIKIFLDGGGKDTIEVIHPAPTPETFSLAFGAILFAFGGASVFPTIQNDMKNRADFWKSVVTSFAIILALYIPVQIIGYLYIGTNVNSNILLSLQPSTVVTVAMTMEMINLFGTFIITFNPVVQSLEDIFNVPNTFGWGRVALRSGLIGFEVIVALAIPNFGQILNLIGGSTVGMLSFVFPPLMYMRLVADKSDKTWPERNIPTWEKVYLWIIIVVGIIGGICSTVSSVKGIVDPDSFKKSCFLNFGLSHDS